MLRLAQLTSWLQLDLRVFVKHRAVKSTRDQVILFRNEANSSALWFSFVSISLAQCLSLVFPLSLLGCSHFSKQEGLW